MTEPKDTSLIEEPLYDELAVLTATFAGVVDGFIAAGHPCNLELTPRQIDVLCYVERHALIPDPLQGALDG